MIIIGLTGGIGSGKTTIAKCFETFGIPIYIADEEAKGLMNRSKVIKRKLIALFGDLAYEEGKLNRGFLASKIFSDRTLLNKMNAIIHPRVASHFRHWLKDKDSPYVIKEAAIIFENNLESQYDYIITVVAETSLRIERIIKRDGSSKAKVEAVISNQLPDDEKIKKSDFVIENNDLDSAKEQVVEIHHQILQIIKDLD